MGAPDTSSITKASLSDLVRAIACLGVITLHVLFRGNWKDDSTLTLWWITDLLHAMVKPAVPLFVMISGAYLLDPAKKLNLGAFWKKRVTQVLLPFLAWSGVYAMDGGKAESWKSITENFLNETIASHLWFVYMLMGLYLILPLLKCITNHYQTKGAACYTALWFAGLVSASALGIGEPAGWIAENAAFSGYFVGGYLLIRKANQIPTKVLVVGIPLLIGANATISHLLQARSEDYFDEDYSMMSDTGSTVALLSFLLFAALQKLSASRALESRKLNQAVKNVSCASFGIYLAHPLVHKHLIDGSLGVSLESWNWSPYLRIPLSILCIACLTMGLLFLLEKIPGVRTLAGYRSPRNGL